MPLLDEECLLDPRGDRMAVVIECGLVAESEHEARRLIVVGRPETANQMRADDVPIFIDDNGRDECLRVDVDVA